MKFFKAVLIAIFVIVLLTCGFVHEQTEYAYATAGANHDEISSDTSKPYSSAEHGVKKMSWLLSGERGGGPDDEEFLTNLDDPTGETYIRVNDLIDTMQTKEERIKNRGSYISVERMTNDGSRMAVIRWRLDSENNKVEVYNLIEGKKELEFNITHGNYPVVSSDLSKFIYELKKKVYVYDTQKKKTSQINMGHLKVSQNSINPEGGSFSPDNTKFCFLDDQKGIIMLDLLHNSGAKRLLASQDITSIPQWDQPNQLIYTVFKNKDMFLNDIYSLDIGTGAKKRLGQANDSFVLSPDLNKMVLADQDVVKVFLVDTHSGKKEDISRTVNNPGSWVQPLQWIHTTVNYMQYSNKVKVQSIAVSSTRSDQGNYTFDANHMVDGNSYTLWSPKVKSSGKGESITLFLGSPQEVRGLNIIEGFLNPNSTYEEDSHIQKVRLEFSDGRVIEMPNVERFKFDEPVTTSFIKMTILEVKQGTKYKNLYINELELL